MEPASEVIARLAACKTCGYHAGSPDASEPVALSALALLAADQQPRAVELLDWLIARQNADGSLGIDAHHATPGWPTGWAVVAWSAAQHGPAADPRYADAIRRAMSWVESVQGQILEHSAELGHDTVIRGWPWVDGTHAWAEPTAINLLALKHSGRSDHPRAREAVRLLHDRLLPSGGANYGNTVVFGQELRAHVQPTGLCLLALSGEVDPSGRTQKSLAFLSAAMNERTTTESLCYALVGLAAHHRTPVAASELLAASTARTLKRDPAAYKLALLALAAAGDKSPLMPRSREVVRR